MASFGESFVDAFAAGRQMRRDREADDRAEKLRKELADAVKPGDVIGPRGTAAAYDAARFSTDAGVDIGNRPMADFQGAQPAAALAPAPQAMPPIAPAPGMRAAAQLTPELAGQAGIVRPTALAGGPPQPAPVAPSRGMASAAALPVAPLGQGMGAPADTVALPDPEKLVFYRDPLTGKGMAVEAGRERRATPADAATSMAAVYMANGDAAKAMALMGEAYDLRSKDFEAQQRTMRQAIISATTRYGGFTPQALTAIAKSYNDQVDDGVTLLPSVGEGGKVAMGLSMGGSTPDLWVDPATGGVSKQPVYADGASIGSYINTLVSGDWGAFQANVQQFQMAKEAAARAERQVDIQGRSVDVAERRAALDERQWNEQAPLRTATVGATLAGIDQTEASTRRLDAQTSYEFGDSLPVRTNNGGAIKDGAFARAQPGYTGSSGGFATFSSPEAGAAAQVKLLRDGYLARGINTVQGIVGRYAPVGPENSAESVANYTSYVARRAGVDPTQPIPESKLPAVAAAMREFESGNTASAPAAMTGGRQFRSPADRDKAVSSAWTEINRQLTAQQAAGMAPQDLKALELSLKARYQEQTGVSFGVPSPTALASGRALGLAPSYVADLRTKGSTPGVIEAAFAKYPQMADEITKLAGPDAMRAYRQRVASPPPAVTRAAGGPAVRDTTVTGALGRAMYNAGKRSGEAQAKADLTSAKKYAPPLIARYREARRNGGQPLTTGQVTEMMYWFRRNPAFRSMLPADMRTFLDRQIAAQQ